MTIELAGRFTTLARELRDLADDMAAARAEMVRSLEQFSAAS